MNIWDHCRLSVRKFGGKEEDYYQIHKFMDSSKLFYFNARHRLLLHNLYGIEMTVKKFGDTIENNEKKKVLVRDISAEHCKEDLSGKVPSLVDWLSENEENIKPLINIPIIEDKRLEEFVLFPKMRSNLESSLLITLSNFGVYLANEILGFESSKILQKLIHKQATVQHYLSVYQFTEKWQFTPWKKELDWLAQNK
ncbi:MAG: hypothetical protein AAGI07_00460 [Bacteroidota bacterium]